MKPRCEVHEYLKNIRQAMNKHLLSDRRQEGNVMCVEWDYKLKSSKIYILKLLNYKY